MWNSLPTTIRQITSYGQFRQHPKTFIRGLEIAAHCDSWATQILLLTYLLSLQPTNPYDTIRESVYTGRSDVTESMVTIRSPFCRYNLAKYVELIGEYLPCYSNKI